ncbi:MAG: hypothetical protein U5J63_00585 [Fodinibius sp.]|nr:hypothetical protein [Fodinibius sp.]
MPDFENVLNEAQQSWMDIDGVLSVGQGKKDQQDCIDVYITDNSQAIKDQLPAMYKGYPVVLRESGGLFSLSLDTKLI